MRTVKAAERRLWTDAVMASEAKMLTLPIAQIPRDVPRGTSKYRNRATIRDGYRFASVLEADRYRELTLLRASGAVRYFLRQVPFHLAPGVLYRADFLVSRPTWNVLDCSHAGVDALSGISIEDTKGFLTDTARVKLAMVEQLYGVKVRVLKRSDVQRFT